MILESDLVFRLNKIIIICPKHKEFLIEFSKDETDIIPELKIERKELKERVETEHDSLTIDQRLDLEDRIKEINEKIKEIQNKKKDYFLDNSKLIFEYFENKKNISNQ